MVRLVRATYEDTKTRVRTKYGSTEEFDIKVGLHQGSALSPFLFIVVMDTLTEMVRTNVPWEMIFADDIVLVGRSEEELQAKILEWQRSLTKGGLKIGRSRGTIPD